MGHGGVAIIWKDIHDNIIQPLEDGGVRINVIEIKTPEPLIIVNSYLPARNGGQKDQYLEILDELSEIIYKYSPTHRIVIMGGMNASLFRTPPNVQDQMFRSFCTKHNITISDLYPQIDTFFHHNGKHSASLDYILQANNQGLVSDVRVQTDDPVNLSDHKVVEATIDIEIKSSKIKSQSSIPQGRKNWEKCDVQIYRENIKVELEKQPKSIYQLALKDEKSENLKWTCNGCKINFPSVTGLKALEENTSTRLTKVEDKITQLDEGIDTRIDRKVERVKEELFDEIITRVKTNFQGSVRTEVKEIEDQKQRTLNLICFNLEESTSKNNDERKSHDMRKLIEL